MFYMVYIVIKDFECKSHIVKKFYILEGITLSLPSLLHTAKGVFIVMNVY